MSVGATIDRIRASLDGRVVVPADSDYEERRELFYRGFDQRPAGIAYPEGAGDVAAAIRLAADSGLEVAVRSGGHGMAGHALTEGGIVIDLSGLRDLVIDPESQTAWAGAGLTTGEYTAATAEYGLATGFGDTPSVGIGGITLGGGIGFLVRKHGLTIDSLLGAEVVTADGRLVHTDAESHPDLFWAIRGGGGNFGVVTRFRFRLVEVDRIAGGLLALPATPEVVAGFVAEAGAAPEELSTIANVMVAPPLPFLPPHLVGQTALVALIAYAGDPEAGMRATDRFRALAEPLADMVAPVRYRELFEGEEADFHPLAVGENLFVDGIGTTHAGAILDGLETSTAMLRAVQLRVLGGAMARVAPDATAFAHRDRSIMANVAAMYLEPEERDEHADWARRLAASLRSGDDAAYIGFLDDRPENPRRAYPTATWARLQDVKRRYDPENLLHRNQNVPPG